MVSRYAPSGAPVETAAGAYRRARLFLAAAEAERAVQSAGGSSEPGETCGADGVCPPDGTPFFKGSPASSAPKADPRPETDAARLSLEARELVCAAAGLLRDEFYRKPGAPVDTARLNALLERRAAGEPLAYLLGEWDFYGYTFKTDARALIPRDDSAAPLELFLSLLPAAPRSGGLLLLDLCAGSGCLGIAAVLELAARGIGARAVLADNSEPALELSRENIARHGLTGSVRAAYADVFALDRFEAGGAVAGEGEICRAGGSSCDGLAAAPSPPAASSSGEDASDGCAGSMSGSAFPGFDGCICNPPYIESAAVSGLDREVTAFEPLSALDGGRDGLDFYRAAIAGLPRLVRQGGIVTFEAGFAQAEAVASLLDAAGYTDIRAAADLQGVVRAVAARVRRR